MSAKGRDGARFRRPADGKPAAGSRSSPRAASKPAAGGGTGVLRVVATPLGNLDDLSPRAREALAGADAIAAEDTRRTGRLLELLGLERKKLLSY